MTLSDRAQDRLREMGQAEAVAVELKNVIRIVHVQKSIFETIDKVIEATQDRMPNMDINMYRAATCISAAQHLKQQIEDRLQRMRDNCIKLARLVAYMDCVADPLLVSNRVDDGRKFFTQIRKRTSPAGLYLVVRDSKPELDLLSGDAPEVIVSECIEVAWQQSIVVVAHFGGNEGRHEGRAESNLQAANRVAFTRLINPSDEPVRFCFACGGKGRSEEFGGDPGATEDDGVKMCNRCKLAWFCCMKCQRAYHPMHRAECRAEADRVGAEALLQKAPLRDQCTEEEWAVVHDAMVSLKKTAGIE